MSNQGELERTETTKIFVDAGVSFWRKSGILLVTLLVVWPDSLDKGTETRAYRLWGERSNRLWDEQSSSASECNATTSLHSKIRRQIMPLIQGYATSAQSS